jgi:heavy metal sensor kinase
MSSRIGAKFFRRADVKMTFLYIITFSLSTIIICTFLYLRLKHQLVKEVDRFIRDETKELIEHVSLTPRGEEVFKNYESEVTVRGYYPIYFRVLNGKGSTVYVSKNFLETQYAPNEQVLQNARNGKATFENIDSSGGRRPFRILNTPFFKDGGLIYIVQLGTHLHLMRRDLSRLRRNILAAFPILLILGSLGGWILARRSLAPIGYIASKAQSITSQNLNERLNLRGTDDEMDDLIQTINGMIERLEGSFKRMAEFTADASHELKTPICAMRGETEVLLSKERTKDEYEEAFAHLIEQFDRMNQMLNDLILLSKSDSSQIQLRTSPLRLDFLISSITGLFNVLAEQKRIDFVVGPLEEVVVKGDEGRLQQLIANLIDNAIKYTQGGSIRVSLEKNAETAIIRVKDTGIGIPKEEQEKIFKRFYRIDKSRSRETGGVGLGLSIAEWIAHAHHGRIEVKSELNHGSTFTVYLPLKNSAPEENSSLSV